MSKQPVEFSNSGVEPQRYDRVLFWYAAALAGLTLFNLIAGGMVTSKGAGLAVPDWPTTFGHNPFTFPVSKWVGNIFYEHGHRLIASCVGLMTIGLAILVRLREPRFWLRRLSYVALAAVVLQGVLGGLTVMFLLPTAVSVSHAGLAQLFFCLTVGIALFLSRGWQVNRAPLGGGVSCGARRACLAATVVIFGQILLGAVARHTDSGLAIPDFPLSYGRVIPPLDAASLAEINIERRWGDPDHFLPAVTRAQVMIHFAHRVGALIAAVVIVLAAVRVLRHEDGVAWLKAPVRLMLTILPVQIALGAATVLTERHALVNTGHVVTGAVLLATSVVLMLRAYRLGAGYDYAAPSADPALQGAPA